MSSWWIDTLVSALVPGARQHREERERAILDLRKTRAEIREQRETMVSEAAETLKEMGRAHKTSIKTGTDG